MFMMNFDHQLLQATFSDSLEYLVYEKINWLLVHKLRMGTIF